jgi:hypothetical protein
MAEGISAEIKAYVLDSRQDDGQKAYMADIRELNSDFEWDPVLDILADFETTVFMADLIPIIREEYTLEEIRQKTNRIRNQLCENLALRSSSEGQRGHIVNIVGVNLEGQSSVNVYYIWCGDKIGLYLEDELDVIFADPIEIKPTILTPEQQYLKMRDQLFR